MLAGLSTPWDDGAQRCVYQCTLLTKSSSRIPQCGCLLRSERESHSTANAIHHVTLLPAALAVLAVSSSVSSSSAPVASGPRTISAPIIKQQQAMDPKDVRIQASVAGWRNRVRFGKTFTVRPALEACSPAHADSLCIDCRCFQEYKVSVELPPLAWTVFKRYSEFQEMHKQVRHAARFSLVSLLALLSHLAFVTAARRDQAQAAEAASWKTDRYSLLRLRF